MISFKRKHVLFKRHQLPISLRSEVKFLSIQEQWIKVLKPEIYLCTEYVKKNLSYACVIILFSEINVSLF